ncbi:ABC transporter ATP-binding protein [Allofustis seminis]|uniref:ABC transporter ATP-binding protein n=1 Tax=Allofustis seminis TaxID=166939 RepID=UPI0003712CB2|nr:ABC transporter ATP-binding protein [Allofustis seminis]
MGDSKKLLEVKDLSIYFQGKQALDRAVDHVSFSLDAGQTLGIVGESGSGKSVTALSIMQLLPIPPAKIDSGEILFEGENLLKKNARQMQDVRGHKIAMIFQEPMTALNPLLTIGEQIMESLMTHLKMSKDQARERAIEMLRKVEIKNPEERVDSYPHQLSGGMRQRVMIAIALSCDPSLLICDEPTTALDVTTQAQILDLINKLKEDFNTSVIMITHDLGVVSKVSENVLVMYKGRVVEYGSVEAIFENPLHPYTRSLLAAIPDVSNRQARIELVHQAVKNDDLSLTTGDNIFDRATYQARINAEESALVEQEPGHFVRIFKNEWSSQAQDQAMKAGESDE